VLLSADIDLQGDADLAQVAQAHRLPARSFARLNAGSKQPRARMEMIEITTSSSIQR